MRPRVLAIVAMSALIGGLALTAPAASGAQPGADAAARANQAGLDVYRVGLDVKALGSLRAAGVDVQELAMP
jgi:hypothetical protein